MNSPSASSSDSSARRAVISLADLRALLEKSGLVKPEDLAAALAALAAEGSDHSDDLLARLLSAKKLTRYQAHVLQEGRGQQLVLGDYLILDRIGAGGMGQVFKALHRRMKRVVAIKQLPPETVNSAEAVRRFQREVEAAARLSHPHIVSALDAREEAGVHYLVMEFVEGRDLSRIVAEHGPLDVPLALSCIRQTALGLAHAHEHGIIHRDIKPGNLLLEKTGLVKILDMGLARVDSPGEEVEALTSTGNVMGTIDYMSPEQALNTHDADARSDIYSLGCTLYFLLTGRRVYGEGTMMQRLLAHREAPIPPLVGQASRLSKELDPLLAKLLAKLPEQRYQTAAAVVDAIDRFLAKSSSGIDATTDWNEPGSTARALAKFLESRASASAPASPPTVTSHIDTEIRATHPPTAGRTATTGGKSLQRFWTLITLGAVLLLSAAGALAIVGPQLWKSPPTAATSGRGSSSSSLPLPAIDPGQPIAPQPLSPENHCLLFDGKSSYVEVTGWNYDGSTPLTLEAWVLIRSLPAEVALAIGNTEQAGVSLQIADGRWRAEWRGPRDYAYCAGDWFAPVHRWTHVASVYDGKHQRLFVNGVRQFYHEPLEPPHQPSKLPLLVGAGPKAQGPGTLGADGFWDGLIDEVRISTTPRYTQNFYPKRRFEKDEHTAVLYHFDETNGKIARDESGHDRDGRIQNAAWISDGDARFAEPPPVKLVGAPPPPADAPFDSKQARAHQEAWANHLGVPVDFKDDLGIDFVLIPPGRFWLGSSPLRAALGTDGKRVNQLVEASASERPRRQCTISRPSYMSRTEVTVGQFRRFVAQSQFKTFLERSGKGGYIWDGQKNSRAPENVWSHPFLARDPNFPVTLLTVPDIREFAAWLSRAERVSYRLPTNAEWEHACRAGTTTRFIHGDDPAKSLDYGWFKENSSGNRHPVAGKLPNAFGLYDLYGNTLEWCNDRFLNGYYTSSPGLDPFGPVRGVDALTIRGGFQQTTADGAASTLRYGQWGLHDYPDQGIRLVREIPLPPEPPAVDPVDLLALADVKFARGYWKKEGVELISEGGGRPFALPLGFAPPVEYAVEVDVTLESPQCVVGIGALTGGEQGFAEVSFPDKTARISIEYENQGEAQAIAHPAPISQGDRRKLRLEIKTDSAELFLNDIKVASVSGTEPRFARSWDLGIENDDCLFLYTTGGKVRFHRATLQAMQGTGRRLVLHQPPDDRELAQWVVQDGGFVYGYDAKGLQHCNSLASIPEGPFFVSHVRYGGKRNPGDKSAIYLARWRQLLFLEVWTSGMTDDGVAHFAAMPFVQKIQLNACPITDRSLNNLQALPRLRYLGIPDTNITDNGLAALPDYPQLDLLSLSGCKVTDVGIAHLGKCKWLKTIGLSRTPVTADGLRALNSGVLRSLELEACEKLDDEAYAVLAEIKQLETLVLRGNTISDVAAGHLGQMTKLKKLDLTNAKITPEAFESLRKLLSGCEIVAVASAKGS